MDLGRFFIDIQDDKILYILSQITNDKIYNIRQVCERYGYEKDEVRYYDVYEVECALGNKILKQTEKQYGHNVKVECRGCFQAL